jgi:hypothetical protein
MEKSRRQFVTASLAGLPLLAYAGSKAAPAFASQSLPQGGGRPVLVDPVLEQTIATVRELAAEAEARPSLRRENTRAIEATLAVQAAHIGHHYDAQVQRALRRRAARIGRAALVDELVRSAHDHQRHTVTHEQVDQVLTRLEQGGFSGCLRDLQRALRAARVNAANGVQAVALLPGQYDFCSDVRMMIEIAEQAAAIICSIAVLEPTWALEPFCAAAGLIVAAYKAMQWWYC